jgi:WD40 repeat-containing protein SMU1
MSLEVHESDVIKLMLQFCKEKGWLQAAEGICQESGVTLNAVEDPEAIACAVNEGRWEEVLQEIQCMSLPAEKLALVYEQILLEVLESESGKGEREVAQQMLLTNQPLVALQKTDKLRYKKLYALCFHSTAWDATEAYEMGTSRLSRREEVASALAAEISTVAAGRLMTLLGHSLAYSETSGGGGGRYDLFTGGRRVVEKDTEDKPLSRVAVQIPFESDNRTESVAFHPVDGVTVALGGADGIIEIRNCETGGVREDLEYQAKDRYCRHDRAVLGLCFSPGNGELLASGCAEGVLKLWKLQSGVCLQKFVLSGSKGVASVCFGYRDSGRLLCCCLDGTVRLCGVRSGTVLSQFRGHTAYVNDACFSRDDSRMFSVSSDGTLRCWNTKEATSLYEVNVANDTDRSSGGDGAAAEAVVSVNMMPCGKRLLVCTKGAKACICDVKDGRELISFKLPSGRGGDVQGAALSCRGKFVYLAAEDGTLCVFDAETGRFHAEVMVSRGGGGRKGVVGAQHHPCRNLLVTLGEDGNFRIFRV